MTQNISQRGAEQIEEVHVSMNYLRLMGERRRFELTAPTCVETVRCDGKELPAGYVIRVPRTLANGVRRWGVSRVALLISFACTPRISSASAMSER